MAHNITGMKKKLLFVAAVVLIACAFTSCTKTCKFCKDVTYENGSVINEGTETQYCGAALLAEEAIPDHTVGDLTVKVECR